MNRLGAKMPPQMVTSLSRPNVSNALPTKSRISADYDTPTKDFGAKGFANCVKTAKQKRIANYSSGPRPPPNMLHEKALAAFAHFVTFGDHTAMARLVLSGRNDRGRALLVAWFERVSQLHWHKMDLRFRGKPDRTRLSVELAARVPIAPGYEPMGTAAVRIDYPRNTIPKRNCAVCGRPAMPDEDTCYTHHSG